MTRIAAISDESIAKAAGLIRKGRLVAFPTETVYGLGANALDGRAVARIFEAKGRPRFNPLIVHVANVAAAARLGVFNEDAQALAQGFWPGPLTLVVPRLASAGLSDLTSAGLPTVALRVPVNDAARALLQAAGVPVAAPSANISGRVSATAAAHVADDFGGKVDMILDGGPCASGIESTIIGFGEAGPVLLRAGAVPRAAVEELLGNWLIAPDKRQNPQAPGMLASHYAPKARIRLSATEPRPGEAFLAFGKAPASSDSLNLSPSGDLREAAANLFAHLRTLDASGAETIAIMPIPEDGLGEAINDRLRRAAAPRPADRIGDDHE